MIQRNEFLAERPGGAESKARHEAEGKQSKIDTSEKNEKNK